MTMKPARIALLALASATTGMLLSDWWLSLPSAPARNNQGDSWSLPPVPENKRMLQSYRTLSKRYDIPTTTGNARATTAGTGNNSWSLRGIVTKDDVYYALIQKGKKILRLEEGGELPDGGKLVSMDGTHIKAEIQGELTEVYLYENKQK